MTSLANAGGRTLAQSPQGEAVKTALLFTENCPSHAVEVGPVIIREKSNSLAFINSFVM